MGLERVFSGNELLLPSHYLRLLLCLVAIGAKQVLLAICTVGMHGVVARANEGTGSLF